ncbi:hydrolase [Brevirhabdus pacifica]|uniref:Hydrolase n=1 Tax=Brevirhabdus pacifica TaxID=1267768 RepID=A0A1U7DKA9_9RHOB|nr:hydrolase [Brevirhabdus pacifica]APX90308.1 hydrolase [Brevirhabdus pacifica]OWU78649.1 isochorismatase [Loktanella sp. 22II-4b]PJJ80759.1 nicotinamidase-related amidase [Brevirhabdus pacifica]
MLIRAADSILIVIDMQERLVPAMQAPARTIRNAATLITAARAMDVPVLLTEQYPEGLGRTVPGIAKVSDGVPIFEKLHFSCMEDEAIRDAVAESGRRQVVLAGMEAHICVVQTAASLMEDGFEVFVVSDATASRTLESETACIERLSAGGAGIVTTEMVVFEWLGRAGTDAFRQILPLVK